MPPVAGVGAAAVEILAVFEEAFEAVPSFLAGAGLVDVVAFAFNGVEVLEAAAAGFVGLTGLTVLEAVLVEEEEEVAFAVVEVPGFEVEVAGLSVPAFGFKFDEALAGFLTPPRGFIDLEVALILKNQKN